MSSASLRHTISTLLGGASPAVASGAAAVADLFEPELDEYAELVVGRSPGAGSAAAPDPVGFMTRGEGAGFTERAASVLQRFDMPPASREHHRFLAELFEHRRAFFKVEWHRQPDGGVIPAASCYFRRRPEIETALAALGRRGLDPAVQDELRALAFTLDKRSVHFVAAALRPGAPVHHKLYFSQYVTTATRPVVADRVARLLGRMGESDEVRALRLRAHENMLPALGNDGETTIFVSAHFTDRERLPWLKIDYPETTPAQAAVWARDQDRPQVEREARMACASLGRSRLSYLGVRLQGDEAASLKYYVDLPARERS
jgi:hypothetical protein